MWGAPVRNIIHALLKIVVKPQQRKKIALFPVMVTGEVVSHVRIGAVYLGNGRQRLGTLHRHQRMVVRRVHQRRSINTVQRPEIVQLANGQNAKIGRGTVVTNVITQAQRTIPCAGMIR